MKLKMEEMIKTVRVRAESGEADEMCLMGAWLMAGAHGLVVNQTEAFRWFKRCVETDEDHVEGLAALALCYINGHGVQKNIPLGFSQLTSSAERGSRRGCYFLGKAFAEGTHGLPEDYSRASRWFRKLMNLKAENDRLHLCLIRHGLMKSQSKQDYATESAARWLEKYAN